MAATQKKESVLDDPEQTDRRQRKKKTAPGADGHRPKRRCEAGERRPPVPCCRAEATSRDGAVRTADAPADGRWMAALDGLRDGRREGWAAARRWIHDSGDEDERAKESWRTDGSAGGGDEDGPPPICGAKQRSAAPTGGAKQGRGGRDDADPRQQQRAAPTLRRRNDADGGITAAAGGRRPADGRRRKKWISAVIPCYLR